MLSIPAASEREVNSPPLCTFGRPRCAPTPFTVIVFRHLHRNHTCSQWQHRYVDTQVLHNRHLLATLLTKCLLPSHSRMNRLFQIQKYRQKNML